MKYWLEPKEKFPEIKVYGKCNFVSVAYRLKYNIYQFYDYYNKLNKTNSNYLQWYQNSELSLEHLHKMLFLDAIIGNKDRHLNNFDIYYNEAKRRMDNVIILDCGASLLYNKTEQELKVLTGNKIGQNNSRPFKSDHTRQMMYLTKRIPEEDRRLNLPRIDEELYIKVANIVKEVGIQGELSEKRIEVLTIYLINRIRFFTRLIEQYNYTNLEQPIWE